MDKYGVSVLAHVSIRETVSHLSPMVSQLIFGDTFKIEDKFKNWIKIETDFDNYGGWVDVNQVLLLEKGAYAALKKDKTNCFTANTYSKIENLSNNSVVYVGLGCSLPNFDGNKFKIGDDYYSCVASVIEKKEDIASFLAKNIPNLLNIPYLWGGRSTFGIDCSGLVQLVFKCCGQALKRDTYMQAEMGENIIFLEEAKLGDLIFFDNEDGVITHVGIYLGDGKILHSSGYVKIDNIDHEGILNAERTNYTYKLRLIKRII